MITKNINLWNTDEQEMMMIHRLNNIVRYNTWNKINNENVAAHSFFVSYFVLSICKKYGIPDEIKSLALEAAVMHDVPEILINDITRDCKDAVNELESLLEPYEKNIISQISDVARQVLFEPATLKYQIAQQIVRHADILSVIQYALSETELGNKPFEVIYERTKERLSRSGTKLESLVELLKNNKGA